MSRKSFHANAACVAIAATTASTNKANSYTGGSTPQFRVTNSSTAIAFVAFGSSTVTATVPVSTANQSGYILEGNRSEIFSPGTSATYVAAVTPTTAATIYFEPGFIQ